MKHLFLTVAAALLLCLALVFCGAAAEEMVPEDDLSDDGAVVTATPAPADNGDDGLLLEEDATYEEMQYGDSGDGVKALQTRLNELLYYTGNISGNFREGTRAAVEKFQEDFGLPVTGIADADTQMQLFATEYRPLRYGSSGTDVSQMQSRLTELGYYTGKISGNYLEGTQSAINTFQQRNGLNGTGEADVDTQTLLYSTQARSKSDTVATDTPLPDTGFLVDENATGVAVTTPETAVVFEKQLARNSKGTLVKKLQTRLTELGYYTGPISGNFLAKTLKAVKAFQLQNGMEDDGIVGEVTWNTIFNDPTVVLPENTPKPTPEPTPVPFAITVDVTNQVTTVYGRDGNGDYTVIIRQMLCSTGTKSYPSDIGTFTLNGRTAKWCYFPRWGGHARYWTRINSGIAFHSVCYNSVNNMDMSVSSYKNLGKRASHGCIRLLVADAKWIYDNCGAGVQVTIRDDMPEDPELRAALKVPPLDYSSMSPQTTPEPTASPVYVSGGMPPMPLEKLQKNDVSEAVWWMQAKLKELGYYAGAVTGTYLNGTLNAVKEFQRANGLKVDGVAGVATLEKLYEAELATATPAPTEETIATPSPTEVVTELETPSPEASAEPAQTEDGSAG